MVSRYNFAKHLHRYGPGRITGEISRAEARSYCRHLATTHYENFTVASLLLPRRLLRHFHSIYAYCRWADDLADETGGGDKSLQLLRWWRQELLACYAGQARHPVMIALRETVREFNIPAEPFLDLLRAFEQDQRVKRYKTFNELKEYCTYSANPVGRLVLYVCGCFDEERAKLADCICTGLQLANFWQDVARDFEIGRVYLPEEDRRRFGYSEENLAARRYNPAFVELMAHEVRTARQFLESGQALVGQIPRDFHTDISLFIQGGLAILDEVQRCDYDVWRRRPAVSKWKKVALLLKASGACQRMDFASKPNTHLSAGAPRRRSPAVSASYAYCSRLTRQRAGNFYYAFRVLPRRQRKAMYALYSFMRIADDLADEPGMLDEKRRKLQVWKTALDDALSGRSSHPIHAALTDTLRRYSIPAKYLYTLIDGVQSDLFCNRYPTFANLYSYCYKVASVVGLACIRIWGCQDARAEPLAEAAGIAFQLTNILRDLPEDARNGRVYLPQEDLTRFGCSEQQLIKGPCDQAYRDLLRFQLQRAHEFYEKAQPLVHFLRPAGRAVFQVMLRIYRGLLEAIEQQGFECINAPVRLSRWRKLRLLAQALPVRFGLAMTK